VHVRIAYPSLRVVGLHEDTFLHASPKVTGQFGLKLIARVSDQPVMNIQPMSFEVWVHPGKRASHD